ncbi:Emp65 protein [Saccharomycopsis crataegensis]|uniref:Emp65 protein n=1 Tax=Saccharomycopsis crataegensis TaxID=43959 RepID=A0AAV5QP40_9ASCO|nr:Emp65 protein [Saccharomycopsis crataegensis]
MPESHKEGEPRIRRRNRATSISNNSSFHTFYNLLLKELGLNYLSDSSKPCTGANGKKKNLDDNFDELLGNILHFVKVPIHIEKFMCFGLLYCLNDFLIAFTILPLKLFVCLIQLVLLVRTQFLPSSFHKPKTASPNVFTQRVSVTNLFFMMYNPMIQASLFWFSLWILSYLDTSKLYHDIRRQSAIKLYVMIGVLDVVDKLVATLGEDLLKFLFNLQFSLASTITEFSMSKKSLTRLALAGFVFVISYGLCLVYFICHSTCLIYQTISLNVAINSYSNALFTLLLSSQFSEIKSTVFKKFDREGLFQNICSDLTERFQLLVYLFLIGLRNLIEIDINEGLIPNFWKTISSVSGTTSGNGFNNSKGLFNFVGVFLNPTLIVLGSELLVDWLKHSYIAKYNHFSPKIYERFLNVLSNDFLEMNYEDSNNGHCSTIEENIHRQINSKRNLSIRVGVPMLVLNLIVMKMSWPSVNHFLFEKLHHQDISTNLDTRTKNFFTAFYYPLMDNLNMLIIIFLIFTILFIVKLILSMFLLKVSHRRRKHFILHWKKLENQLVNKGLDKDNEKKLNRPSQRSPHRTEYDLVSSPLADAEKSVPGEKMTNPFTDDLKSPIDKSLFSNLTTVNDILNNDYKPGHLSTVGLGVLDKDDIKYLYDDYDKRKSIDQYRVKNDIKKIVKRNQSTDNNISNEGGLDNVVRYEMSSKRIW